MRQLAIATVLVALCSLAFRAQAGEGEGCCACLNLNATNATAENAYFCVSPSVDQIDPVTARCAAIAPGANLICYKTVGNSSCSAQLAGNGISCPASPAPVASELNLATLVVSLAGLGGLLLHRRRRRS